MGHDASSNRDGDRWISQGEPASFAVVLVHGWNGHHRSTWTYLEKTWWGRTKRTVSLVDLCAGDPSLSSKFGEIDYYSFKHAGGPLNGTNTERYANALSHFLQALRNRDDQQYEGIALVAHSLGGLICRHAVVKEYQSANQQTPRRVVGLLTLGTPHYGTELARFAVSATGDDMVPLSDYVTRLNREWAQFVRVEAAVDGRGRLVVTTVGGLDDMVVPDQAASIYDEPVKVLAKDHKSLPKAEGRGDPTYTVLSAFLERCHASLVSREQDRARALILKGTQDAIQHARVRLRTDVEMVATDDPCDLPNFKTIRHRIKHVGVPLQSQYLVSVYLATKMPVDPEAEIALAFGPGDLESASQQEISRRFAEERPSARGLAPFLTVETAVLVSHSGATYPLELLPLPSNIDRFAVKLVVPKMSEKGAHEVPFTLDVTIVSALSEAQRSWQHRFDHLVTHGARLTLSAPFELTQSPGVFWPPSVSSVEQKDGLKNAYGFQPRTYEIRGPIAPGARVSWRF